MISKTSEKQIVLSPGQFKFYASSYTKTTEITSNLLLSIAGSLFLLQQFTGKSSCILGYKYHKFNGYERKLAGSILYRNKHTRGTQLKQSFWINFIEREFLGENKSQNKKQL